MRGLLGSDHAWLRWNYLKIWGCKKKKTLNHNVEKIAFKVVQMKFIAMHITYKN